MARMSHRGYENARLLAPTPCDWGKQLITIYERKLSEAGTPMPQRPAQRSSPPKSTLA